MSGRLDEAVEAMVERLGVMYPKWHPTNRRIVAIRLLAALPAGVYVSSGKSDFTPLDADQREAVAWAVRSGAYRLRGEGWPDMASNADILDGVSEILAALSATDTEES